jgi:branched-chain amino acid transport system ATP-binding protein
MAVPMLEIRNITAGYGRLDVLDDITLSVTEEAIVGLLGPNGAGKSTLIRSISGLAQVRSGQILFEGRPIQGKPPEDIVELGIIQVPQGRMLFPDLSIADNLRLGAFRKSARSAFDKTLKQVEDYFPVLRERRNQRAGILSGGEQQMLAIGRALVAQPRLLILDEPSLGLAPLVIESIFDVLRNVNAGGLPVLVAEQNAMKVLQTAETVYVLENGRIAHRGQGRELAENETIQRSYLGI